MVAPATLGGKIHLGRGAKLTGGTEYINYQRGSGTPSQEERDQLHRLLPGLDILKVKLAPGKYDRDGFPVTCYEGFRESVAQLANQFTDLPIYCAQDELEKREKLEKAKKQTRYPRVVLATSKAETSLTLADADFVVDLGLSRGIEKTDDLLEIQTFAATAANREQRRGRVL